MTKKPLTKFSTVMLIDDSEIDNFINQKMIEGCNIADRIYIHTSSKSALEFLKNIERTTDVSKNLIPEIIFLDINMPIMLTTSINPSDIERSSKNKYIIKYINKPLTQDILNSLA